jgi:hypothetical protein
MLHRSRACLAVVAACLLGPCPARGGGCPTLADAPHSRWAVTTEGGAAWLITPCGERFFSIGINCLNGGAPAPPGAERTAYHWRAFDTDFPRWLARARARVRAWGFNTAGASSLPPEVLQLPVIPDLELGRTARFHWVDPFDPATAERMRTAARGLVAPYRGSPYRIGYFSDNEAGWWNGALFGFFVQQPATNHTKQRLVALLRAHYGGDWRRFARDFVPPAGAASWDDLLRASGTPARLRPGGEGIQVVRRWTGVVAEHYYRLTAEALHAADPEALFFGDRLPIYYDPFAVRAMTPWVDAVATNYNVDSPDGWIARYYFDGLRRLTGGKPVLVSEWFFAADENRTGNRNNGHLMTVPTQRERARGAAAAARWFARQPALVGLHWFQYYDHPKGGRSDGEDYDFGLVDVDDRPYEELLGALGAANTQLAAIHAEAPGPCCSAPAAAMTIPRAAIDPRDRSLAEWPKERSVVPGLEASPGEVPFGDLYLAWSAAGLHLAVIGMDYYDPALLAYGDVFPRGEAFRVDWGVDAGAGARRFALSVIPPKVFPEHAPPMMRAELCRTDAAACAPVPGAITTYFGSDQPRLTLEVTLPWAALGMRTPPDTPLHMELAVTAFYRSRWMSWSGRPPAAALRARRSWHTVTLGADGAPS